MKPNTVEWELDRKKKIGASDAPIIFEVSPYKTPSQLFQEKLSETLLEPTYPMKWGKKWEPTAIHIFSEITGFNVVYDTDDCYIQSISRDWQVASFDGLLENGSFVETKCPLSNKDLLKIPKIQNGQIPIADENNMRIDHMIQMQHQFLFRDCDFAYYFCLFIDKKKEYKYDCRLLKVYRNDDTIRKIIEKEEIFYSYMKNKSFPSTPPN